MTSKVRDHLSQRHPGSQLPLLDSSGLLPHGLHAPQERVEALHAGQVHALGAGDPDGVAQDDLELQGPAALPVEQHAGLAADVALGALEDALGAREVVGERTAEEARDGGPDLVHNAGEVEPQLGVARHVGVAAAAAQDGRGVEGGVDAELVPAHQLEPDLVRHLDVADAAQAGPVVGELVGAFEAASLQVVGDRGGAAAAAGGGRRVAVGAQVDPRPAVLLDGAWSDLRGGDDGHGADDGGVGKARAVRLLDAHAVLDQDDGRARAHERRNELGVIGAVRECLGGDDDEVPFGRPGCRRVRRDSCRGWGREHGMWLEGVVAEGMCLKLNPVVEESLVVGASY